MAGKIFVNYRRDDSASQALNVAQYLESTFGKNSVFIDVDRLRAGENFPAVLEDTLSRCAVMLTIIGPQWLKLDNHQTNTRRIDNPEDWVRLEIERALARKVPVIPVLIGGAQLPKKSELPASLQALTEHQVATISTNGFRHEMAGLANDLRTLLRIGNRRMSIAAAVLTCSAASMAGLFYSGAFDGKPVSLATEKCERYWDKIKDRDATDVLEAFIKECGETFHGTVATSKLKQVREAEIRRQVQEAFDAKEADRKAAQQAEDERKQSAIAAEEKQKTELAARAAEAERKAAEVAKAREAAIAEEKQKAEQVARAAEAERKAEEEAKAREAAIAEEKQKAEQEARAASTVPNDPKWEQNGQELDQKMQTETQKIEAAKAAAGADLKTKMDLIDEEYLRLRELEAKAGDAQRKVDDEAQARAAAAEAKRKADEGSRAAENQGPTNGQGDTLDEILKSMAEQNRMTEQNRKQQREMQRKLIEQQNKQQKSPTIY